MPELKNCPKLNFPSYKFRMSKAGEVVRIWDNLRGCRLVLTPEEWVRQHVLRLFTETMGLMPALVRQECPVCLQGMSQRADVVAYRRSGQALMLVECKAPDVKIDASVYAQAVRYNTVLGAKYIMITNGLHHYIYEYQDGDYRKLSELPDLKQEME